MDRLVSITPEGQYAVDPRIAQELELALVANAELSLAKTEIGVPTRKRWPTALAHAGHYP
jgi:hypothetical protein